MSRKQRIEESVLPGEQTGERFIAVLLWAQGSSCTCEACQYLRGMAGELVKKHIPGGSRSGQEA